MESREETRGDSLGIGFYLWMLSFFATIGLTVPLMMLGPAWVMPGFMLPFVYGWISMFFVSWTKEGWPSSPRAMLGMVIGGMAVIYTVMSLTVGWN